MNHIEAKQKLEAAIQDFVTADFGPDHYMGDYVIAVHVVGMTGPVQHNFYLHDGRGAPHSLRGLIEEAGDWAIELKVEDMKHQSGESDGDSTDN